MDTSSTTSPKRPLDSAAHSHLTGTATRSVRPKFPPSTAPSVAAAPTPPTLNSPLPNPSSQPLFRLLCPSSRTPSILPHLSDFPPATVRIDDPLPSSDYSLILILDASLTTPRNDSDADSDMASPAQQALLRVFEIMAKPYEGKGEECQQGDINDADGSIDGQVVCRLLAPSNLVGRVLGRGGKVVEKIRQDTMTQVKVFPKDQIPACASPGDELIQITGSFSAVKKALLSVSSCLQDDTKPLSSGVATQEDPSPQRRYASGHHNGDNRSRGYSSITGHENAGAAHREEDVVFRLLCQPDKVGSLIGKGGSIVRALQNETGASINVVDTPDLDERVVIISARESLEQTYSPAQEAVIRVHCRIAEIGHEPGSAVVARLLVHPQQIGYLVGRGGHIISEMRRGTGTTIHIFPREQHQKSGPENNEVIQVVGSLQSVQDALFHITNRLRDTAFPMRPHAAPNFNTPSYLSPHPAGHNAHSPGSYSSQGGAPRGFDRFPVHSHPHEHQPAYSHGMGFSGNGMDGTQYPHGIERPGPCPTFDRPSPQPWTPQKVMNGEIATTDVGFGMASRNDSYNSSGGPGHFWTGTSVEMVIPQSLFCHISGENNTSIAHVQKISGARVVVTYEPKPGTSDGKVMVSGAPDQIRAALTLVHAFIFCGKTQSS